MRAFIILVVLLLTGCSLFQSKQYVTKECQGYGIVEAVDHGSGCRSVASKRYVPSECCPR